MLWLLIGSIPKSTELCGSPFLKSDMSKCNFYVLKSRFSRKIRGVVKKFVERLRQTSSASFESRVPKAQRTPGTAGLV